MYPGTPWGGLVAGFCEVVAAARPRADVELIRRACDVAARCHQGQTRYSGDPYITHPVAVATILARLEEIDAVDDQTLCVALLHDTVEDTPYSLAALRCDFGAGIAAMVTEHMALDRLDGRRGRTVRSQLQALAQAALIRNRPSYPSRRRVIVALDIERSTTRPDPVKADLRTMLYELFDAALRSAGVQASCRGPFIDRGDGLLALIDPVDQARVLKHAVPASRPRSKRRTARSFSSSPATSTAGSCAMPPEEPAGRPSTASSPRRSPGTSIRAGSTLPRQQSDNYSP